MGKELITCSAELDHLPETRRILEQACEVRYIAATPQNLEENLPAATAYFAHTAVQLTAQIMAKAHKLKVIATPSTGLDHLDLKAAEKLGIPVLGLKDDRELLDRIPSQRSLPGH